MIRILLLLLGMSAALSADTLRLGVSVDDTHLHSELQPHVKNDDLFPGIGLGRIQLDQEWDHDSTFIFPLSIEYLKKLGPGSVRIGANYTRYQPHLRFDSIGSLYLARTRLKEFEITDAEGQLGYDFALFSEKLTLAPWIGAHFHGTRYTTFETTLGPAQATTTIASPFQDGATGMVYGIGAQFQFLPDWAVFGSLEKDGPRRGIVGAMRDQKVTIGTQNSSPFIQIDQTNAGTLINLRKLALGVEYSISQKMRLRVGVAEDLLLTRHPGYQTVPVLIVGGLATFPVYTSELLTDSVLWDKAEKQRQFHFFTSVTYRLEF